MKTFDCIHKSALDFSNQKKTWFSSDLGAHIDGFIAVAAHTVVASADASKSISGRKADTILAAYWAGQAALRLLKPGLGVNKNFFSSHFLFRFPYFFNDEN